MNTEKLSSYSNDPVACLKYVYTFRSRGSSLKIRAHKLKTKFFLTMADSMFTSSLYSIDMEL